MSELRKGDNVAVVLSGAGAETSELGVILDVRDGEVWLDNGPGNDPTGPYDATTGRYLGDTMPGFSSRIEMPS